MTPVTPRLRTPCMVPRPQDDHAAVQTEVVAGLQARAASLPPKLLYDEIGSRLFEVITALPEYYPTRTEAAILARHAATIAAELPAGLTLVDLGAGNCEKAARLLEVLRPARYVAVDIALEFLQGALLRLQCQYPALEIVGVGLDFSSSLTLPPQAGDGQRLLFYPGSSIGNFLPAEALAFLRRSRAAAQGGGLLIGVDLVKPVAVLDPAYNDALGVTAAFNRNLLLHVNRLLGSDFELAQWRHRALYNQSQDRIEMYLEAVQDLTVHWPGAQRRFRQGECIHTEHSCKYTPPQFEALLHEAGFARVKQWRDAQDWFAVFLACA